jgi:polyisoprenoid-binding protein YceI
MTTPFKHGLIFCLLIMTPLLAQAAMQQWVIVPSDSQLTFTATQNNSPVSGEFKSFGGEIKVDPEDLSSAKIVIDVNIDSLSTSYTELKKILLSADWFDSKKFPKALYQSTQLKKTGKETYEAIGTLMMRDKQAPVVLNFTVQSPSSNKKLVIGKTHIRRSVFNVGQGEWASTSEIKDEVNIQFKLVAVAKE